MVRLHVRDAQQADAMRSARVNARYLPNLPLPEALQILSGPLSKLTADAAAQDLFIVATPMAGLRQTLTALAAVPSSVAWLCKGFESGSGLMPHEVQAQVAPALRAGALNGPSFAQEVASGQPTALVAASPHAAVRDALVAAFHGPALRVYANDDIVGVEVGGAVKNVLAIATGICDGLSLGHNARAALMTRGIAEIGRLCERLGGHRETLMGLSGLGDLILTCTGDLSRNRQVGLALGQGKTLEETLAALGHVAEGVGTAREVARLSTELQVDMPIARAVAAVIAGELKARDAVAQLMSRAQRAE